MQLKRWFAMCVAGVMYATATLAAGGVAQADEDKICLWRGSAPWCSGTCPSGYKEEKRDKQGPAGSKKCMTGTKAYCCFSQETQVFGHAPVCDGNCPAGWTRQGDSDVGENGSKCVTGKAAICVKNMP